MMKTRPIYVEIRMHASMEELWEKTQTPEFHSRWDLRFTEIEYLPRPDESEPQRFLYQTRIGFGLAIQGEGETIGGYEGARGRTSALKFSSEDPKSLIRQGAGYWKYIPTEDGIRFLTQYDYGTRFGQAGQLFDTFIFRPLMGWATAWSFDRLRLWLEEGMDPGLSMRRSLVHAAARSLLAAAWIAGGLLLRTPSEMASSLSPLWEFIPWPIHGFPWMAVVDVLFGAILLFRWRDRSLFLTSTILLILLSAAAAFHIIKEVCAPTLSMSLVMMGLAIVGYQFSFGLPSSSTCLRQRPKGAE